jgi:hypothetical protein
MIGSVGAPLGASPLRASLRSAKRWLMRTTRALALAVDPTLR